ncbi:hypothetical protein ACWEFL_10045 [Streptomyces sp. NPDC004838]
MPQVENTDLKSAYADKVRGDLEENTVEQDRVRADIATLQEQLAVLEQDHELLRSMNAALGGGKNAPAAGRSTPGKARAKKAAAKKATVKKATASRPAAKPAAKVAEKPAEKAASKKPAKKPAKTVPAARSAADKAAPEKGPALTDLIHRHLVAQSEPRTAREIARALADAHPERNTSDNLVRTTTERLVARGRAERAKQGITVYYTAVAAATAPTAATAETGADA